jgi:glycosyltransferase involved in cell wall biosynthesis
MLVVNVLGRSPQIARHRVDGIEVMALPPQAKWPYHRLSVGERSRLKAELPRLAWAIFIFHALLYFFSGRPEQIAARWLMLATLPLRSRERGAFPQLDTEETGYWSLAVRRILKASGATTIHADNLLAIQLCPPAGSTPARRIGVVRDNRFLCVRLDQQTRIGDVICRSCRAECHTGTAPRDRRLRWIARHVGQQRRLALRRLDDVVVTSRYLERQIASLGSMPPVTRIANPAGSARRIAEAPAAEWDGVNILMIGQINDNKGQEALAARLPELIRRIPDVRLHFAGRGDAARERMIAAAGLYADRLQFHGYVEPDAVHALYQRCQIVALPTRWPEPFGRVPLEAGLGRRPVVAFDVGGLAEQIVHGETGLVVAAGDYGGFVEALVALAKDPARRERLGAAGERRAASRYGLTETVRAYEALWGAAPATPAPVSRARQIAPG